MAPGFGLGTLNTFNMATNKLWTIREVRELKSRVNTMTHAQIAQLLGRSISAVRGKAVSLGLRRPENIGQFQKGHAPSFNPDVRHATLFKKGHIPANKRPEGYIAEHNCGSRRVKRIVVNGKWMYYHKYIWQQHFGPIPSGYMLRFINGDPLDCRIENLRLLTKREHFQLNVANRDHQKVAAARWAGKRDFVRAVLMCEV